MSVPTRHKLANDEHIENIEIVHECGWGPRWAGGGEYPISWKSGWFEYPGSLFITNKRIIFERTWTEWIFDRLSEDHKKNEEKLKDFSIYHPNISHTKGRNERLLSSYFPIVTSTGYLIFVNFEEKEYKIIKTKNGNDLSDILNKKFFNEDNQKLHAHWVIQEKRVREIEALAETRSDKRKTATETLAETLADYEKAIEIWKEIGKPEEATRIMKETDRVRKEITIQEDKIDRAKYHEKLLEFDEADEIYKELKMDDDIIRVRKLKAEQGAVKVTQKVVQGDEVTKTEIKDSVLNRSNIGGSSSKMQELEKLTEMKKEGLISEEECEKMKQEIIG